jgi:iron(III) transport system permease protein
MAPSTWLTAARLSGDRALLALLALAFLSLAFLPMLQVIVGAIWQNGSFGANQEAFLFTGSTWHLFLKSVAIAGPVAVLATALGLGMSFMLVKFPLPYKGLLRGLLMLPLLLPAYITTVAWVDVLLFLGLPPTLIYSPATVIFVLTILFTPVAILIFSPSLASVNANHEAAALLVAPYPKVFFRIVLPLIRPALLAALLLIFILALSEFTVPAFLSVPVLVTNIFTQFSAFYNYTAAITQSSLLVFLCLVGLLIEHQLTAGKIFLTVSSRNQASRLVLLSQTKWRMFGLVAIYLAGTTFIPLGLLTFQSFERGAADFLNALSLLQAGMEQSLLYAAAGAALITLVGFGFSYLKHNHSYWGIDLMLLGAFCIPSVVAGIALIGFYNTPLLHAVYASPAIVIIAYVMRFTFLAERIIRNRLLQLPESLEQAARIHGAGTWTYLRRILLPLSAQAIFGAFIISFIFCLSELGTVIMVYPPGTALLPIQIFTLMANAPQSVTSSLCLVSLLFTAMVLGLLLGGWHLARKKLGGAYG